MKVGDRLVFVKGQDGKWIIERVPCDPVEAIRMAGRTLMGPVEEVHQEFDVMIMGDANIARAERVLRAPHDRALLGINTAVLLVEIKWAFARHGRTGFEIAEQVLLRDFRKTLRTL